MIQGLRALGLDTLTDDQLKLFHAECDKNEDGEISLTEFTETIGEQVRAEAEAAQAKARAEADAAAKAAEQARLAAVEVMWHKVVSFFTSKPGLGAKELIHR